MPDDPHHLVRFVTAQSGDLIRERWDLMGHAKGFHIRLMSFRQVALRSVLSRLADSIAQSPEVLRRGPCILVACDLEFSMEFLDLAIPFLQLSGNALPSYHVCGATSGDSKRFFKRHSDLALVANLAFHPESAADVTLGDGLIDKEFDFAVVRLDSEIASLATAESILRSPTFHVGQVVSLVDGLPVMRIKPDDRLQVVSLFTHGLNSPEFGDQTLEKSATENHETYLAGLNPAERKDAPHWENLGEAFKNSNRWAVLHRQAKVAVWKHAEEPSKPALIEMLACSEHQRWMAEKIMTGWRAGLTRDNGRKIHPDIQPYATLSEEVREKDRVQVRKALGLEITSHD